MDLKEKFVAEMEHADWSMLKDHHTRGTLFIVDSKLDLADVGVAIAEDKVNLVKIWLDNKEIYQKEDISDWEESPHIKLGKFIIVQPYVLLQLDHSKSS